MQQLTQQLKTGKMEIVEVPLPQLQPGHILVRNYYSLISPGTEGKTVSDARKGYLAKAKSRKNEVQQVVKLIKTQGLKSTYKMVMNKLEALSPLGYSTSGEVIAIANDIKEFRVGDLVACGGGNQAVHADVVCIPKNLCAKVKQPEILKEASFSTIASIALQGIRQANVEIGSKVAVIGLGLIGVITQKLLKASGIDSFGIDIDDNAIIASKNLGFKAANRTAQEITTLLLNWTQQIGVDAVIITAATSSLDPVNFAGLIARRKSKVVIVGAVPTGFDRNNYYKKELDLRMSCSYGPGRYDSNYESKGTDYPIGYVRWTEQRNMQTICDLLANNAISFNDIISHTFSLEKAPEAYELILNQKEPHMGLLIEYDKKKNIEFRTNKPEKTIPYTAVNLNTGIIGAGSFAQNILLPIINKNFSIKDITCKKGNNSLSISRKFSIPKISQDINDILSNRGVSSVFILTQHNLHAMSVIEALYSHKNVYVEKPLAINIEELSDIIHTYRGLKNPPMVMIGFNRRFSSLTDRIKAELPPELPISINLRVNAGSLPPEHWVNDPALGGGRLIGEGCHFIDLAIYLTGSKVEYVNSISKQVGPETNDTYSIQLSFKNGSIANIAYFSDGAKSMSKELVEIFTGENSYVIDDFIKLTHFKKSSTRTIKLKRQDKGHIKEISLWAEAQKTGISPIDFYDIVHSHQVVFAADLALKEKRTVWLEEFDMS